MKSILLPCIFIAVVLLTATVAEAHVVVIPNESQAGATEHYTIHVPTEGKVATASVELEIPPDVTVTDVPAGADYTFEARREGGRITAIIWKQEIKPEETAAFAFVATNPDAGTQIAWKAHQHFVDGSSTDWVGPKGDRRPASLTHLAAAH